jgi:3-oxoacyl-[acyl-carrier-protein] synthase II
MGNDVSSLVKGIEDGRSAVQYMEGWNQYTGLRSLVGAPAELINEKAIPRKNRRSMGRMSIFAVQAAKQALANAGIENEELTSDRVGCIIGSTMGSAKSLNETFEIMLPQKDLTQLSSMKFFQCCVIATSAACASALHAVNVGYDLIRLGKQDAVLCGGAEELHPTVTGSFDVLFATSSNYNDEPNKTPRPFDRDRDGLVCGEGSGILVIEQYEHALKRNAKIYAEILGYHTCGSGVHVSQPDKNSIASCLRQALASANVSSNEVDYINAHATATIQGDREEAKAIKEVFGDSIPVSSLKGYIGHTLGASGALELIVSLAMMEKGIIYPTLNLDNISPDCQGINHVMEPVSKDISIVVKNCFAFGGINSVLVCKKV